MSYRCEFISAESGNVLAVTSDPAKVDSILKAMVREQGESALDRYQLRITQEMSAKQHFLLYVSPKRVGSEEWAA